MNATAIIIRSRVHTGIMTLLSQVLRACRVMWWFSSRGPRVLHHILVLKITVLLISSQQQSPCVVASIFVEFYSPWFFCFIGLVRLCMLFCLSLGIPGSFNRLGLGITTSRPSRHKRHTLAPFRLPLPVGTRVGYHAIFFAVHTPDILSTPQ